MVIGAGERRAARSGRVALGMIVCGVLWLSAAAALADPTRALVVERDEVEIAPPAGLKVTSLLVDNRLGDIRVEGHERPVITISARKQAASATVLERLKVTVIPDANGPVRISTAMIATDDARPIPTGAVRIDLVIRAPRGAHVAAQLWNGRLALIGMENGADLLANEGQIVVHNASGSIMAQVASGTQQFVEVVGKVDARVISGEMNLDTIRGERLDASVQEGHIDSRQVRVREAWLRAIRGDIRFRGEAVAGGQYHLGSFRGDVEVELVTTAPVSLVAHADAGTVSLPPGMERRSGGGAAEGAIVGTAPGSGAPAMFELRSRIGNIRFAIAQP